MSAYKQITDAGLEKFGGTMIPIQLSTLVDLMDGKITRQEMCELIIKWIKEEEAKKGYSRARMHKVWSTIES